MKVIGKWLHKTRADNALPVQCVGIPSSLRKKGLDVEWKKLCCGLGMMYFGGGPQGATELIISNLRERVTNFVGKSVIHS